MTSENKKKIAESQEPKKGILSNWIVRNLLLAALFVAVILVGVNIALSFITQHGKEYTVPDFTNMTFAEARYTAEHSSLKVEVADSVYVRRMKRGAVYAQNPNPGSKVKKGRRVFLTLNAMSAKKVTMPLLVGYSMRQAKAELSSRGLMLGKLIYVSDIATNNVLRQLYQNHQIEAGTPIESGSTIDLVVGLNSDDSRTYVPDVVGLKYLRAVDAIHDNSLNINRVRFDEAVRTYSDSLNAVVYRQSPPAVGESLTMGAGVTIFLTTEETKIQALQSR